MVTKLEAARIAVEAGIAVVLTSADQAGAALAGEPTGTLFHATGRRQRTRLLWLAHATEPAGSVALDAGAVRALTQRGASLLAAGVTGVSGRFHAGDPIDLVGPDGGVVARGLVAYDAEEIPQLLGRSSKDLEADLGPAYGRELVHRDDLVLL
jgi:glutamate 5-kinase